MIVLHLNSLGYQLNRIVGEFNFKTVFSHLTEMEFNISSINIVYRSCERIMLRIFNYSYTIYVP